jgi:apolipoprotein D and lipocalin family protein
MKFFIALFLSLFGTGHYVQAKTPVTTVDFVNLDQYLGKWYEVASIPQFFQRKCVGNTTAEYSGTNGELIKVVNSCDTKSGKRQSAEARAKVTDKTTNAKLKVTFVKMFDWIFAFGGNYWIIDLAEDYSYAVVGEPSKEYAWILSRTPAISEQDLAAATKSLISNGYDLCLVLSSIQDGGFQERKPLCEIVK